MGRNLRGSFYSNFISYLCTVAAQFLQWDKFFHRTAQGYSGQYLHKFTGRNRPRGNGCVRSSHAYACSLPHSISQEHKRSRCAPALRASAHPAKPGRLAVSLRSTATQAAGRLGRLLRLDSPLQRAIQACPRTRHRRLRGCSRRTSSPAHDLRVAGCLAARTLVRHTHLPCKPTQTDVLKRTRDEQASRRATGLSTYENATRQPCDLYSITATHDTRPDSHRRHM